MSKKIHILHSNMSTNDNFLNRFGLEENLQAQTSVRDSVTHFNYAFHSSEEVQLGDFESSSASTFQRLDGTLRNFHHQKVFSPGLESSDFPQTSKVILSNDQLPFSEPVFLNTNNPNIRSRNILRFLFTIIYGIEGTKSQVTVGNPPLKTSQLLKPSMTTLRPIGKKVHNVLKTAGNDVVQTFSEGPSLRSVTLFGILPIFLFFGTTQTSNYVRILQNSQNLTAIVGVATKTQSAKNGWFPETKISTGTYQFQEHLLRVPDYISKIFIIWGLLYVWKGVRPQRKMFKEGGNASSQTRIIWPNQASGGLRRFLGTKSKLFFWKLGSSQQSSPSGITHELKGLTAFRPVLETLIQSLRTDQVLGLSIFGNRNFGHTFQILRGQNIPGNLGVVKPKSYAPKGYLFVGPPGTGKTLLAQAIAREANVPLLCVSASEIQKQIEIGTRIGALRLRKLFEQARRLAPCILFLDEIDAIGRSRGNEERNSFENLNRNDGGTSAGDLKLFTEFLIQMDSFPGPGNPGGFVVIGTTNFLSSLDSAFIRSGRFDRILGLNYPSKQVRIEILQWYSNNRSPSSKFSQATIPWNYFGYFTEGFSPADLSRLVNESLLAQCKQKGSQKHTFESLQKGFNRIQTHKKYLH